MIIIRYLFRGDQSDFVWCNYARSEPIAVHPKTFNRQEGGHQASDDPLQTLLTSGVSIQGSPSKWLSVSVKIHPVVLPPRGYSCSVKSRRRIRFLSVRLRSCTMRLIIRHKAVHRDAGHVPGSGKTLIGSWCQRQASLVFAIVSAGSGKR